METSVTLVNMVISISLYSTKITDHENAKLSANKFTSNEHIPKLNNQDPNYYDQDLSIQQ